MPKKKKPDSSGTAPAANGGKVEVCRNDKGQIRSHVRNKWLVETPEERVRQEYLCVLVNEYGFPLAQFDEEREVTGRGSGHARADYLIWRTAQDRAEDRPPLIVVECKSDNVTICPADYAQGDNYARIANAQFFVTHNSKETRFWRVRKDRMPGYLEEIENIPHADASDREIDELLARLKTFKEDEFADLLHKCHNIIRNREKKDPVAAFDEIAKILFVKVYVERELATKKARKNVFTVDFLNEQIGDNPLEDLFQKTKREYRTDRIFDKDETLNLRPATGLAIVKELERYNLSATSEDIKGIAFERFLGKTFRGEIGQFFTPRPIVEFMVRMVEPKEGEAICDPASGSGGFLIRFFEIVRQQILADADREYQKIKDLMGKAKGLSPAQKAKTLRQRYDEIQKTLNQSTEGSRLWKLANRCIYGTDANDRMARTSKMNMIMHGDGHGGVHHHDGFLNVNGIFEGRFDIVLTNPPFGASVEPSDVVTEEQVAASAEAEREYMEVFGDAYREAQATVKAAKGKPIATLFELPKARGNGNAALGKIKTEILFIERCLSLLKPGGRLGIVLPEGVFNNPSLAYVRRFCEDRAFVRAVVSLPQDTFVSSGASVKASLLFMQKYTNKEKADYDRKKAAADKETRAKYADEIQRETARLQADVDAAKAAKDAKRMKAANAALAQYQREMEDRINAESLALLKERFPYPVFLYEAEHVGITATGEPDATELYEDAKLGLPAGMTADATALDQYRSFRVKPDAFDLFKIQRGEPSKGSLRVVPPAPRKGAFAIRWARLERWDTFFWREDFVLLDLDLKAQECLPLGQVLRFVSRPWKKEDFPKGTFRYVEVSSVTKDDGIVDASTVQVADAPSRAATILRTGDFILSTTRPYLGAFARVPAEYDGCVCSSAFAVADGLLTDRIDPDYLLMFLRGPAGLRQVERRMTGGLYPAIVQAELERVLIPVLPKPKQQGIVATLNRAKKATSHIQQKATMQIAAIQALAETALLGNPDNAGVAFPADVVTEAKAMILGTRPVKGASA